MGEADHGVHETIELLIAGEDQKDDAERGKGKTREAKETTGSPNRDKGRVDLNSLPEGGGIRWSSRNR